MQELVGRLTALDPVASESLKVVGYFDALVGGQVSIDVLARSAAVLAGCVAGVRTASGRVVRAAPNGARLDGGASGAPGAPGDGWPGQSTPDGSAVWIERADAAHANDAMLVERFAIAVAITLSRAGSDTGEHRAAEVVVDASASADDRAAAASRLRLEPHARVRAIALPAAGAVPPGCANALLSTAHGFAQVVVIGEGLAGVGFDTPASRATQPADGRKPTELSRAGIGISVEPARLPASWSSALVALRLADARRPVVRADELGALLTLAAADADPEPHPDVAALDALAADRAAVPTLDALAEEGTVRGAAAALGVHHSTVQSRLGALTEALGYDPRTPEGRTRYAVARTMQRLRNSQL